MKFNHKEVEALIQVLVNISKDDQLDEFERSALLKLKIIQGRQAASQAAILAAGIARENEVSM